MPELNEVLDTQTVTTETKVDTVVDITTIEKTESETTVPQTSAPAKKAPVKKAAPAKKAIDVKQNVKPETQETKSEENAKPESTATANSVPVEKKQPTKKKKETDDDNESEEDKALRRPPMEQLTKDFEKYLSTLEVGGQQLKKLEYKCGKVIYGLHIEESKDFRVIAFKARKKSKSVAGKSRCIFYFGLTKDLTNITKKFAGTSTTEFGKCSVQVKKPVQLILDKATYNEHFGQDVEKVMTTLKGLSELTIEHKNEQWKVFQDKVEAKKKAETEKDKKTTTTKVQKKATVGEE